MSHLWVKDESRTWAVAPLECEAVSLDRLPLRRLSADEAPEAARAGVALLRRSASRGEGWVLLAGDGRSIRINGLPLVGGIRVLDNRDEIHTAGTGTLFFSTETRARVETFPGGEAPVHCPRCKLPVEAGTPAVRCPGCGLWHHESAEFPCWTYSDRCAMCDQPTDLNMGFRFAPEDL